MFSNPQQTESSKIFSSSDYLAILEDIDNKLLSLSIEHQTIIQKSYTNEQRFFGLPVSITFDGPGWELLRAAESAKAQRQVNIWVEVKTNASTFDPVFVELGLGRSIMHVMGVFNNAENKETFQINVMVGIGSRRIGEFKTMPIYTVSKPPKSVPMNKLSQWIGTDLNRRFGLILRPRVLKKADHRSFSWYFCVEDGKPVASAVKWSPIHLERQNKENDGNLMNDKLVRVICEEYTSPLLKARTLKGRSSGVIMQMDKVVFELAEEIPDHRPGQVLAATIQTDELRSSPFKFVNSEEEDCDYFVFQLYVVDSTDYAFTIPKDPNNIIKSSPYIHGLVNTDDLVIHQIYRDTVTKTVYGECLDHVKMVYLGGVECKITGKSYSQIHFEIPSHLDIMNNEANRLFFYTTSHDGVQDVFSLPISLISEDGAMFWSGLNINVIVPFSCYSVTLSSR